MMGLFLRQEFGSSASDDDDDVMQIIVLRYPSNLRPGAATLAEILKLNS